MKCLALSLLFLLTCLNANAADPVPAVNPPAKSVEVAPPAETPADPAKAEVHKNKARLLVDQKKWQGALEEIRLAVKFNPKSADAWLILGTVAMRVENDAEAHDAFTKYLATNPPADKATAVRQRVAELEVRLDKKRQEEQAEAAAAAKRKADRFGPSGNGFFLGYSPTYKPKVGTSSDLNSSVSNSFDLGFRFSLVDVGLRFASGSVDLITVKDEDDVNIVAPTAGAYSNGKHSLTELYGRYHFEITSPEVGKSGTQFLIPLHMGGFMNTVKFAKSYWNMGLNLGTGGQFRWYSGSHFVFDVSGLYYFSLPLTAIQNNSASVETVHNAGGQKADGNIGGFDLRAGITILF